ncbi:MAG: hypothetical protein GY861_04680 [bacterium]|nr:hypothetical protein [bacterium]
MDWEQLAIILLIFVAALVVLVEVLLPSGDGCWSDMKPTSPKRIKKHCPHCKKDIK